VPVLLGVVKTYSLPEQYISYVTRSVRIIDILTGIDVAQFNSNGGTDAIIKRFSVCFIFFFNLKFQFIILARGWPMQNTNTWANNPRHYTSLQSTTRCSNEIFVKFYKTCSNWCKPCSPNATNNGDRISTISNFHYSTFTIFWFFSFALHSVVDYKFYLSRGFFLKNFF